MSIDGHINLCIWAVNDVSTTVVVVVVYFGRSPQGFLA